MSRAVLDPAAYRLRTASTAELDADDLVEIRALMDVAFGDDPEERFEDEDWAHALGGLHVIFEVDGRIVGHAAVVERRLEIGRRPVRTGYVEAVAVLPEYHGRGLGSAIMEVVDAHIRATYELGALGTGRHAFYERLGWRTWRGPAFVRTADGERRTPDEEGYILVLPTPSTPIEPLDRGASISCEERPGDDW